MANPRIPSDYWDESEQEELHYPHATPRRVAFAHALGVVGVLGTLTLAAFAFAPRVPFISSKLHSLFSKDEPALRTAEPIAQVAATNPPAPSVTAAPAAPAPPAPNVTMTEPSTAAPAPETAAAAPEPAVAAAPEPAVAAVPEPAIAPAPVAAPTQAASASDVASDEASKPAPQSAKPTGRALAASTVRKAPRSEPPLTVREIERRRERYEAWLKQEGLEPVR